MEIEARRPDELEHSLPARLATDDVRSQTDSMFLNMEQLHAQDPQLAPFICSFCSKRVTHGHYNPLFLMQVLSTTAAPRAADEESGDEYSDDDDDDDAMDTSAAPPSQPVLSSFVLAETLTNCCSAQCWVAATLDLLGVHAPISKILLEKFPYLNPEADQSSEIYAVWYARRNAYRQQLHELLQATNG
jgi:hypothetical protein